MNQPIKQPRDIHEPVVVSKDVPACCSVEGITTNIARDKKRSFRIPVTLWVYGKKTSAIALIDSGATTNLIDKKFVENNHLVTNRLAVPFPITNADGTENN